jgi:Ni/Co efflux regulator RcnB
LGERLPQEVRHESIDPEIKVRLGVAPKGHEFVRVATDILLIAVGTGLVVDAIQDLGQ